MSASDTLHNSTRRRLSESSDAFEQTLHSNMNLRYIEKINEAKVPSFKQILRVRQSVKSFK